MTETIEAVVAGHICLDIIPVLHDRHVGFRPGQLVEIGPAVVSTGGPVSNTGLALHILGIRTRLMGKTGDDAFGHAVREIVAAHGAELANGMAVVAGEHTSYTVILSPPGADRMFLHCPGCNDTFRAEDVDYAMLGRARLFHFGYPPLLRRLIEDNGRELVELLRRAKATGVTVSLDMCMPDPEGFSGSVDWPGILADALPFVDIFLPSLDETLFTLEPAGRRRREESSAAPVTAELLDSVSGRLLSLGPGIVGLKLGEAGFYLRTAQSVVTPLLAGDDWSGRQIWAPCFEAEVVGTTGAGDAAIAGFLAGCLRGLGPEECLTAATAAGACNVEAADALGGIRPWEETMQRARAGWLRKSLPADPPQWRRDPASGIWHGPADRY